MDYTDFADYVCATKNAGIPLLNDRPGIRHLADSARILAQLS